MLWVLLLLPALVLALLPLMALLEQFTDQAKPDNRDSGDA
jgi:hypothetical protein